MRHNFFYYLAFPVVLLKHYMHNLQLADQSLRMSLLNSRRKNQKSKATMIAIFKTENFLLVMIFLKGYSIKYCNSGTDPEEELNASKKLCLAFSVNSKLAYEFRLFLLY